MKLHAIETGLFKLDGGAMFGVVPKSLWSKRIKPDDNNLCTWAMRCLLIEDGDRLILIDTGLGDKQSEKFFSFVKPHGEHNLHTSLQQKGFSADDITDVILTHLHFDHVGGAVSKDGHGKLHPTFKNATYWSHSSHWKWALHPNEREKESFLTENIVPLQEHEQIKFIDQHLFEHPSIDFLIVNGHTESQLIPKITVGEQLLYYCADLLPSVYHIPLAWVMGYDIRPLVTLKEKISLFHQAISENAVLIFEHDATHEACTLRKDERDRVVVDQIIEINDVS